jgi:hypothetical protein
MDRRSFIGFLPAIALLGCASQKSTQAASGDGPRFSEADKNAITAYYEQNRRGPKPPVPAQRAVPGSKLISGERPSKLPTNLDAQLSNLNDPYTRLVLGADVILINRNTHDISDVIAQVAY